MQDLVSLPSAPFALPIVHPEPEEWTIKSLRLIILSLCHLWSPVPLPVDETDKTICCLLAKTAVLTAPISH